jgi:phospho-N-acetylmuramoyl-pentapeptide-transferase
LLYYLLYPLTPKYRVFNVLTYISFRAVMAAVTGLILSFILGPIILRALRHQAVHQVVREGTPDTHASKGSTPTMGGLIIIACSVIPILLWSKFSLRRPYVLVALFVTLWMGAIGLLDDYLKLKQKREGKPNRGLV